jgi:hypothetical protein
MLKKYRKILVVMLATVLLISNKAFAEETEEKVIEDTTYATVSEDVASDEKENIVDSNLENENQDEIEKTDENEAEDAVADDSKLEDAEALQQKDEDLLEEEDEVELIEQTFTAILDGHKIEIVGNLPKGAAVSVNELTDVRAITYRVLEAIDNGSGYFEKESFEIYMSYEEDGKTKNFVPSDFDKDCQITVTGIGGQRNVAAFVLGDECEKISNSSTFTMKNESKFTVGEIFDTDTSIVGTTANGEKNCKIYAKGDGVEYSADVNKDGWYLFTDVDYSKAHFGCSFEITTE